MDKDTILKYQQGGGMAGWGFYKPLPLLQPNNEPQKPTEGSSSGASDFGLDKDILKAMLGEGVTNDVMAFSKEIEEAGTIYMSLSEMERDSNYGRMLRSKMKGNLGELNSLKRSKKLFDEAIQSVEDKDADSDYAVTSRGVIVKDMASGRIAEINLNEYNKLKGNSDIKILTNAELIAEREYNPHLTNDSKSIQALKKAVSIKNVKEEVLKTISSLGSTSNSMSDENMFFYSGDSNAVKNGVKELMKFGAKGYYKISEMAKETSNVNNLKLAMETMWDNLSDNSKMLLRTRAVQEGHTDYEARAKELALSMLSPSASTDTEVKTGIAYDSKMTEDASSSSSNDGNEEALTSDFGYYQLLVGHAGNNSTMQIQDTDGNVMSLPGTTPGGFRNSKGELVGEGSLRNVKDVINNLVDVRRITFGGNAIQPKDIDAIVYDGGNVLNVKMPVKIDPDNGLEVPDLDMASKINQAREEVKGLTTNAAKASVYANYGIPTKTDASGNLVVNLGLRSFLVFDAKVNSSVFDAKNKNYIRKVASQEFDRYNNLYKYNSLTEKEGTEYAGTDWTSIRTIDDVYKGKVFMPLLEDEGRREGLSIIARALDGKPIHTTKTQNTLNELGTELDKRDLIRQRHPSGGVILDFTNRQ